MKNKLVKFFKITTWKRWFFIVFFVISSFLFIGLSFGLKSKDSKLTSEYKNSVSLTIKPTYNDGLEISDEAYSKQLLFNLQNRLQNQFENSIVTSNYENKNVWNLNITNISSDEQYQEVINAIRNKEPLTLLPINAGVNPNFFNSTIDNNSFFNQAIKGNGSYSLRMNSNLSNEFYQWIKSQQLGDKVIIWKNFDILNQIVKNAQINESYAGSIYEYLFTNKRTPENSSSDSGTNLKTYFFKDSLELNGKKYKPQDFIVSKNEINDFDKKTSLNINKEFGVHNYKAKPEDFDKEFYNVSFWVSSYSLNNYSLSYLKPSNGTYAYLFLIISLVSIYLFVSIFVVINYGYLGLFLILILAIIIFLSLLMMSIFFGDYNSISIILILLTTFISLDFIIAFLENVKSEFKKENSISKSIEHTIKKTQKYSYLKALLLVLLTGSFYIFTASIFNQFSIILLIISISILILQIPLTFIFAKNIINLKQFKNKNQLIGFWEKDEKLNKNTNLINENDKDIEIKSNINIEKGSFENKKSFILYKKYFDKKSWLFLIFIPILLITGLITFLTKFFISGSSFENTLNLSSQDRQQIVLRIYKNNNDEFTNDEIKEIDKVVSSQNIKPYKFGVLNNKEIELYFDKNTSKELINNLNSQLINLYGVKIISSSLINSNTYQVMQYTLYGILIAMILMSIFILLWMNWAKALAFLITISVSFISIISIITFGILELGSLLFIAILFSIILSSIFTINFLIKIFNKLKYVRIEEMPIKDIKKIIYNEIFLDMKPFLKINFIIIFALIILMIFIGSITFAFILFMLLFMIINFINIAFLLPKLIYLLESRRAKMRRKVILNSFWDTEKIKEQTFKGINDIK